MRHLMMGGGLGLVLGMALQLCGLAEPAAVRGALNGRRARMARALVFALGLSAALTALLMWLAVIDTDAIPVASLSGSLLAGAVVCGVGLGLTGQSAETALAGIGGGPAAESLWAALGCALGAALLPYLAPARAWLDGLFPAVEGTLFRVTLQRPFLLGGEFLGQGCLGLALMVLALFIRDAAPAEAAPQPPAPEEPPASIEPADVQGETFVAALPGEEPVVVDTEADPPQEEPAPASDEASAEEAGEEGDGTAPPGGALELAPDPPGEPVDPVEQAAEALQPMNPVQQMMMPPEARIPPEKRMDSIRKGKKNKSGGKA